MPSFDRESAVKSLEPYVSWFSMIEPHTPELQRLHAQGVAAFDQPPLDLETEVVRAATLHLMQDKLVVWWARGQGAAFALEAFYRAHFVMVSNLNLMSVAPVERSWTQHWRVLRQVLGAVEDDEWGKARDLAARLRPSAPRVLRILLAFLFPEEPAWSSEEARDGLAQGVLYHHGTLLASLTDSALTEELCRKLIKLEHKQNDLNREWGLHLTSLVELQGEAAVPSLEVLFQGAKMTGLKKSLVEAMVLVESPRVAEILVRNLSEKVVASQAQSYFERHPHLLAPACGPLIAADKPGADLARNLLARSGAPAAPQAAAVEEGELPGILRDPPWLRRKAREPRVVKGLPELSFEERVDMQPEVRERLQFPPWGRGVARERSPRRDQELLRFLEFVRQSGGDARNLPVEETRGLTWGSNQPISLGILLDMTDEGGLQLFNQLSREDLRASVGASVFHLAVLARWGPVAIPGLLRIFELTLAFKNPYLEEEMAGSLLSILDTPRVAGPMARFLAGRKALRAVAEPWLRAHPEAAAVGLIPLALAEPGKERTQAEAALRLVDRQVVLQVASRYGALEAVEEVLSVDDSLPDKLPKLPDFWTPASWARPRLPDGKALPLAGLDALGTMLQVCSPRSAYRGLASVGCQAGAFAWDLFSAWLVAGAPAAHEWAFYALGHLGGDTEARKLATLMEKWPLEGAGGKSKALRGLVVLACMGTSYSLMRLQRISQTARVLAIKRAAGEELEQVALARGLSLSELEDRLVPDLDLDQDGSRVLDFGPRQFRVSFDQHLQPYLVDAAGTRQPSFPRANKQDDAALARASSAVWKALVKDAETVAKVQIRRLEEAMCLERDWSAGDFRALFVEHPLLRHLGRRLLWSTDGWLFRLAEDGSLADLSDRPMELGPRVSLPHPLVTDLSAWGQVFADYEILQPFEQIGRAVYRLSEAELSQTRLSRGWKAPTGRVAGLTGRGWQFAFEEGDYVRGLEKMLPGGLQLSLQLDPGWWLKERPEGEQKLAWVACTRDRHEVPLRDLPAVLVSEMIRDCTLF